MTKNRAIQSPNLPRPPIVAVLGHVDHGKTTLLDAIRHTSVAAKEHGGITQHIGAYQVKVKSQLITFIDTPGHEAFAKMRSRGARVADIVVLVVAADDSVKPQTVESLQQIKEAGVSLIVAINKIDLPSSNVKKVQADLAKEGVQVEGFGGTVPFVSVSGKNGTGIQELLDMIILVAQMQGITSEPQAPLEAVVIETRVDKGKGMVASVLVKKGALRKSLPLFEDAQQLAKVRAMFDENGNSVEEALPGKPVEVLGFSTLPQVGSVLRSVPITPAATAIPPPSVIAVGALPDFLKPLEETEKKTLYVLLKADTAGSIEAIIHAIGEGIHVVSSGIGDITEADILQAKASGAIAIGFQVKAASGVDRLARVEKVVYRTYTVIYQLLEDLEEVLSGMAELFTVERELGRGQIIAEFPYDSHRVAGTKISSGRLARGDTVKIMRGEEEIARARIKSMRRGKEDVTKAEEGNECGVIFDKKVDFTLQDGIIAVTNV
ncbi:translation initiation factor IF-2 [Patescibacteria group bacterium]|nr:translation initiation factor IF-2 [Patescibacteria group bacterium]MBU1472357.1 translation initiation factor IF-2 [Patescibacteria group bacterium]MBU2460391.1 translation initiation factor IF-2 [Patescibacteria group bacterium]MBU2544228.1 translation initiation factor IF-2 [Patescibacteria group bacterium]